MPYGCCGCAGLDDQPPGTAEQPRL